MQQNGSISDDLRWSTADLIANSFTREEILQFVILHQIACTSGNCQSIIESLTFDFPALQRLEFHASCFQEESQRLSDSLLITPPNLSWQSTVAGHLAQTGDIQPMRLLSNIDDDRTELTLAGAQHYLNTLARIGVPPHRFFGHV